MKTHMGMSELKQQLQKYNNCSYANLKWRQGHGSRSCNRVIEIKPLPLNFWTMKTHIGVSELK
jgi:hypothetical protein